MLAIENRPGSADPFELHPTLEGTYNDFLQLWFLHRETNPNDSSAVIEAYFKKTPGQKSSFREHLYDFMQSVELIKLGLTPKQAVEKILETRKYRRRANTLAMWWDERAYTSLQDGPRIYKARGVALKVDPNNPDNTVVLSTVPEGWNRFEYPGRWISLRYGDLQMYGPFDALRAAYDQAELTTSHLPAYSITRNRYIELGGPSDPSNKFKGRIIKSV